MKKMINQLQYEFWVIIRKKRKMLAIWLCTAILFGCANFLTPIFRQKGSGNVALFHWLIGFLLFCFVTISLYMIQEVFKVDYMIEISKWKFFVGCFLLFVGILLVGIFYLMIFYPGTGMYDTIAILTSRGTRCMNQHPWFYVLLVQFLVDVVFRVGGDYEISLLTLSILQIAMTAAVYSYCLMWLYAKNINKYMWIAIATIYICCPFLNLMMVNIFKDIPFSLLMVMWIPFLYDFWETKGENLKKLSTLAMACLFIIFSLVRNNGVYVSSFVILAMYVVYPSKWKQYMVLICMLVAVVIGSHEFEK